MRSSWTMKWSTRLLSHCLFPLKNFVNIIHLWYEKTFQFDSYIKFVNTWKIDNVGNDPTLIFQAKTPIFTTTYRSKKGYKGRRSNLHQSCSMANGLWSMRYGLTHGEELVHICSSKSHKLSYGYLIHLSHQLFCME